jgi:hypothetical protein
MKANRSKSIQVTFTTRREKCPPVHINNVQLPQEEDAKYLGLNLDRRLTWHKHIFAKRKQLGNIVTKMYWLLWRKSKLFTSNKLHIHKSTLKPIWTYGIQLWGTASTSNIEILKRFQSKVLNVIVDALHGLQLFETISKYEQLKKNSAATALNTVLASAHTQTA